MKWQTLCVMSFNSRNEGLKVASVPLHNEQSMREPTHDHGQHTDGDGQAVAQRLPVRLAQAAGSLRTSTRPRSELTSYICADSVRRYIIGSVLVLSNPPLTQTRGGGGG